jgi:protein-tyrosine kinase
MSKIEDALNKVKKSSAQGNQLQVITGRKRIDQMSGGIATKQPSDTHLKNRTSSTKQIALMDEGDLFSNDELDSLNIIHSESSNSKILNSFRELRTQLIHKSNGENFVVMITSCQPDYDTGLCSINLASAFSLDESKTSLVIDCNLRNPSFDKVLNLNFPKGMTDYFENDDVTTDNIMYNSGVKRLRLIPAGEKKESASEFFTSKKMRDLMRELLDRYSDRYVFLNTASIIGSADTKILVDICDYVVLDVPYGQVTTSKIKEAADAIGEDKLLGIIFSHAPPTPSLNIPGFG